LVTARSVVKVLGPELSVDTVRGANIASVNAELMVNGASKSEGTGAEVKGSPASSLCWLADQGVGLKAGELVITGAFCKWKTYAAGDKVTATFDGLGEVILNLDPPTPAAVPATAAATAAATAPSASTAAASAAVAEESDDDDGGGLAALFGDDLDDDDESDGDFEAGEEEPDIDIDDASDNDDDTGGGPSAAKKARVD